jgi:hypothetical protein
MPAGMYKAPTAEQLATLRERAARFRSLAKDLPSGQDMLAERLIAAAADLDAKALALGLGE